ncbi:hypothetical protein QR685DRAFT_179240 [Neurospora intermedia]|uniref:Uncharacterized protein n=1 Tax=Neurospora intermedia TaxID=5142 RepID=A0ABR3DLM5_NEUIN
MEASRLLWILRVFLTLVGFEWRRVSGSSCDLEGNPHEKRLNPGAVHFSSIGWVPHPESPVRHHASDLNISSSTTRARSPNGLLSCEDLPTVKCTDRDIFQCLSLDPTAAIHHIGYQIPSMRKLELF